MRNKPNLGTLIRGKRMNYKIINDSMLNMLSHIEENIDCVITDPPYELGFMGKSWDSTGIAFNP